MREIGEKGLKERSGREGRERIRSEGVAHLTCGLDAPVCVNIKSFKVK